MKHCIFPRCDCPDRCKLRHPGVPINIRTTPVPMRNIWASDFGEITLPADFPLSLFRSDGWWDGRFKALREKWEAWIATETAILEMQCAIPDRLHGAAINARGEAI